MRKLRWQGRSVLTLEEYSFYWWVDHISKIASIPLTLLGFGFTIWQLLKTKSAVQAAYEATLAMRRQVRRTNLATLLPQLTRIEDEIDRAVANRSVETVRSLISDWRWQAGETRIYLSASNAQEKKILRSIQASISVAADTQREIHREIHDVDSPELLVSVTDPLRKAVSRVTGELGAVAAQQVLDSGGVSDG